MCPFKIWKSWTPHQRGNLPFSNPAGQRIRWGAALWALMLVLVLTQTAYAGAPVQVISGEHHYVFSESLDFRLAAKSDSPIVEVILFYGREGERLVRRVYPTFTAGKEISAQHTEPLEKGQFAPGTRIRFWWRLRTEDGGILETEPEAFEYTDTNQDWHTLSGKGVDLFWYGGDEAQAKDLLARADEALARLESTIGLTERRRVRVYVYNSQTDMSRALAQRGEGYDERVMTLGVSVDEITLLLLGSHRDARQTIAHELSHIVAGLATDNPYTGLPRWLDEGLAMYAEGEIPEGNKRALEEAVQSDSLLSVRSMSSYSGQASQVDLFYGEVYSVVDFMLKDFGRDKMSQLLEVFAQGTRQEDALQRVYGFGLDGLDDRWRARLGLSPRQRATETVFPTVEPTPQPLTVTPLPSGAAETMTPGADLTRVTLAATPLPSTAPETRTPVAEPTRSGNSACFSLFGAFLLPLLGGALWAGSQKLHGIR